ncbi:MAG: TRAP transporter small permease subunit [Clostridia bacterium]|nr:TRAP transporter small permease subunit [Clostridia bacterium]
MKLLKKIDFIIDKSIKYLGGLLIMAILLIVIAMIFSRYVLRVNLGGIEEFPVYLMIICVWLSAVRVSRDDQFVKIELINSFVKTEKGRQIVSVLTNFLSAVALTVFTPLAYSFFHTSYKYGDISPATGFSLWLVFIFPLIATFGMAIYFWRNTFRNIWRMKKL